MYLLATYNVVKIITVITVGDTPTGYIMPPVFTLSFVIKLIKLHKQ